MYFAYLKSFEGCDYTIGCGNLLIELKGQNLQEIAEELKNKIKENYTGDRRLNEILIIEGIKIELEVSSVYEEIDKERNELRKKSIEKNERKEFERLKKKYA